MLGFDTNDVAYFFLPLVQQSVAQAVKFVLGDYDSQSGIGAMCVEAIRACQEVDGKETLSPLYNNVVLSGGGSLLAGMAQRLKVQLSHYINIF